MFPNFSGKASQPKDKKCKVTGGQKFAVPDKELGFILNAFGKHRYYFFMALLLSHTMARNICIVVRI